MSLKRSSGDPRAVQTLKAQLRLRQLILDGKLRAGQRVTELNVVELTGVSRTPVRAALVRLAEEGLLEAAATSGGFVVRVFDEIEVYDAIDVRGTLEGAAARRAAERCPSNSDLSEIRECVAAMDAIVAQNPMSIEHVSEYARLNESFHALLVKLARSTALARAIERIVSLPFASPSAFVLAQSHLPDARRILTIGHDQHHGILDAIAAGEGVRAENTAREHSKLAKRDLLSASPRKDWLQNVVGGHLILLPIAGD